LFIALAMAFFGFQQNNLGLLVAGLVLFLLPAVGLILTDLKLFNSEAPFYFTALGYIVGYSVFILPGLLGNLEFSLSATPSASYLSTALGQTSPEITSIMNNYLAPRGENMAILGLAALLLVTMREVTDNIFVQGFVTFVPASLAFALLHGVRNPFFLVLAAAFMAIWITLYLGDELGIDVPTNLGIATFAATVGLHQSNNVNASGGLIEYYSTILGASPPILYLSYLIVLIDVILFGYVVIKTVEIVSEQGIGGLDPRG